MKKIKGGLETVIAIVIVTGLVVALILSIVIPMANEGDNLIETSTDNLTNQQVTIGPQ